MRVRSFPFSEDVERFAGSAPAAVFVVEQNRDAQFRALLTLETAGKVQAAIAAALQRAADLLGVHRRGGARGIATAPALQPKGALRGADMTFMPNPRSRTRRCRKTHSLYPPRLRRRAVDVVRGLRA